MAGQPVRHLQAFSTLLSALAGCMLGREFSQLVRPSPVPVAWLSIVSAEPLPTRAFAWEGLFSPLSEGTPLPAGVNEAMFSRLQRSVQLSLAEWCRPAAEASPDDDVQLFTPRRKARGGRIAERANIGAAAAQPPAGALISGQKWCVASPAGCASDACCLLVPCMCHDIAATLLCCRVDACALMFDITTAYGIVWANAVSSDPCILFHAVLPAALAEDADLFEACLRGAVLPHRPSLSAPGVLHAFDPDGRLAHDKSFAATDGPELQLTMAMLQVGGYRLLAGLVRCGMRDAARRLARILAGPAPLQSRVHIPPANCLPGRVASWSIAGAPVPRYEELCVFLLLDDSDAQWDATLSTVLKAADDSQGRSVMIFALGVSEIAAADLRLEQALERAFNARAAAVADWNFAVAVSTATGALAAGGRRQRSTTRWRS